jgi:hypothetical protein
MTSSDPGVQRIVALQLLDRPEPWTGPELKTVLSDTPSAAIDTAVQKLTSEGVIVQLEGESVQASPALLHIANVLEVVAI